MEKHKEAFELFKKACRCVKDNCSLDSLEIDQSRGVIGFRNGYSDFLTTSNYAVVFMVGYINFRLADPTDMIIYINSDEWQFAAYLHDIDQAIAILKEFIAIYESK